MRTLAMVLRVLACCLPIAEAGAAQNPPAGASSAWATARAAAVRTIDPADTDFADLEPLRRAIGESRVVLLGEQTHSDCGTFLAKSRVIRFLHERMGFDVLLLEQDGISTLLSARALSDTTVPLQDAVDIGISRTWGRVDQIMPLWAYVRDTYRTANPLQIDGMDFIPPALHAERPVLQRIERFFDAVDASLLAAEQREFLRAVVAPVRTEFRPRPIASHTTAEVELAMASLDRLARTHEARLRQTHGDVEFHRMLRVIEQFPMNFFKEHGGMKYGLRRDSLMAENALWLMRELYPGRKIIISAASNHILRNASRMLPNAYSGRDTIPESVFAGHHLYKALGDSMYAITFNAYDGILGYSASRGRALQPAPAGSLEEGLVQAGHAFAFVDIRGADPSVRRPFNARGVAQAPVSAEWWAGFDAFFFIRSMPECTTSLPPPARD